MLCKKCTAHNSILENFANFTNFISRNFRISPKIFAKYVKISQNFMQNLDGHLISSVAESEGER